jgi:hypothetical protein
LTGSRSRLADGGGRPEWPLSRNGSIGAARGRWRKIVLLSSKLRSYPPSLEICDLCPTGLLAACSGKFPRTEGKMTASAALNIDQGYICLNFT